MKKIISVLLVAITVFSMMTIMFVPASAAHGTTYIVTTKANYWYPGSESITVSQKKEEYYSNYKKTKIKKRNVSYRITCTPTSWSGKKPKTISTTLSGSSKKIKLEKNATYKVKITYSYIPYASWGTVKDGYAYISGAHKATYY